MTPTLSRIAIYPIKSLDPAMVDRAEITAGGALACDRRWALVDDRDNFVNGKRHARIHQLSSSFDLAATTISISALDRPEIFTCNLSTEIDRLEAWLSDWFGFRVRAIENPLAGFPDDTAAFGPTIISTATLQAVCEWFPALDLTEARRRFRTNLEIDNVPAFWEDSLFGEIDRPIPFHLGDVPFLGINPCRRCNVPTRDSHSGAVDRHFQSTFSHHRQQTLPPWANASRFDTYYRLALNTQISPAGVGKFLKVGDELNRKDRST
jgi:uncharacterized protein